MTGAGKERRLNIHVRGTDGSLLAGADITFLAGGVPLGGIEGSDGRGDITLPQDFSDLVTVVVTYAGKTESASIDPSQGQYTFQFKATRPMKKVSRSAIAAGVLASVIVASLFLVYLPPSKKIPATEAPADPSAGAADRIMRMCAGGSILTNEGEIKAGLSDYLGKVGSRTRVSSGEVGAIITKVSAGGPDAEVYKAFTKCLRDQTELALQEKGVEIGPTADPGLPAPTPIQNPSSKTTILVDRRSVAPKSRLSRGLVITRLNPLVDSKDGKSFFRGFDIRTDNVADEMYRWRLSKIQMLVGGRTVVDGAEEKWTFLAAKMGQDQIITAENRFLIPPGSPPAKVTIVLEYDTPEPSGLRTSVRTFSFDFNFANGEQSPPLMEVRTEQEEER